jgi:hypothetical protein
MLKGCLVLRDAELLFTDEPSRDVGDTVINIDSTDCCWLSSDARLGLQAFLRQQVQPTLWKRRMVIVREAPTTPPLPHSQSRQLAGPPGSPVPSPGELGAVFR